MSKYQKDFPLWLAIVAPVLLVAAIVTFFIGGKEQQAAAVDQTAAGIAYLEALEQKTQRLQQRKDEEKAHKRNVRQGRRRKN